MKKLSVLCILIAMALSCAGCGSAPAPDVSAPADAAEEAPAETPAPVQEPESEPQAAEDAPQNPTLVVYFSATGTTRGVAERIAALTGADLAEIVPAQPYTAEDLNYNDGTSRAAVEQNTPDARPEIANEISLEGYTTVYLGYPIWWGDAPHIMSSFVESHDFTGITVIPFCTSSSSGIGRSGKNLADNAKSGKWLDGRRFSGSVSESELRSWIDGLK